MALAFAEGLSILGKPVRLFNVLALSILAWITNLLPIYIIGLSFGVNLSFIGSMFVLTLGAFAAAIPAAPGFIGVFHYATQQGMIFLGLLGTEEALSYATVLHACYFFPVIVVALILFWKEGYSLSKLKEEAAEIE